MKNIWRPRALMLATLAVAALLGPLAQPAAAAGETYYRTYAEDISWATVPKSTSARTFADHVYGYIQVTSRTPTGEVRDMRYLRMGEWDGHGCHMDDDAGWDQPYPSCARKATAGTVYDLDRTRLCTSDSYRNCESYWDRHNNWVDVVYRPGDTLRIEVRMRNWYDDGMCFGSFQITKLSTGAFRRFGTIPGAYPCVTHFTFINVVT